LKIRKEKSEVSLNALSIIFLFLALIAAILGIFGVPIAHLEFWVLGFLAAALLAGRWSGDVIRRP
jgi:hypothetical protein